MSSSALIKILSSRRDQSSYRATVDKLGLVVCSSPDLQTIIDLAASELGRALDEPRCAVVLRRDSGRALASDHCSKAVEPALRERLRATDLEMIAALSPQSGLVEMTGSLIDTRLRALASSGAGDALQFKSVLIVPLVLDAEAIGAIIIYRKRKHLWSAQKKLFIQAVASNLALAIYQIQLHEKASSAAEREALTNRLLTAIRSAIGVDDILKVAVDSLGAALKVTRASIYMHSGRSEPGAAERRPDSKVTARAEYRANVLVPSVLESGFDIKGSPLLGQLLNGEIIAIPDTNESHPIVRAIGVRLGVRALVLAPIAYNGQMVAALALEQFDHPREFFAEEVALIRLVSEQIAVALYQAELYREAQEAARREALISRISSAIRSSLDPDGVLQAMVTELGAALSVCRCRLALLPDPLPESIRITNSYTADCCAGHAPMPETIPVPNNFHVQAVLSSERPLAIDDITVETSSAPHIERLRAGRVKSLLATAIRLGGKPIGMFSLHHCERKHSWTEWEIDLVQAVAEQAAVAIRQAELYREARESATRAALVNQIVAAIRRSLDLNETLQVAVEQLGSALGASRTYFRKLVGDEVVIVAEHLSDPSLSMRHVPEITGNVVMNYLIETRRTMIIDDVAAFIAAHPELTPIRGWNIDRPHLSQIICPIFVNGRLWGGLVISQADRVRKWTASEISLIEAVTAQIEVAVSHSHLFEEAKHAARVEALISHIIHGINQSNRLSEIYPIVARELGEHLQADAILIARHNPGSDLWIIECEYSLGEATSPGRTYRVEDFKAFDSLMKDGFIVSADTENDERLAAILDNYFRPARTRAFMTVHVCYNGEPRLALTAVMRSGPRAWYEEEAEVMRAAANQLFTAIERAELFEQVSRGKFEWEATFDALTDGVFIFDQHGLLRRVNEAAAAFEGVPVREMIGRRCCTLLQGIEGDGCRVAQVVKSGRPVTFELVPERLSRPVLVTIAPLADGYGAHESSAGEDSSGEDSSGEDAHLHTGARCAGGAVCIVRDLSELRAAEAAAREQRSFLIKLIEHANDAIFAFSPEGKFIWFNEQLATLSGCSRDELMASDYRRFLPPEDKKTAVDRFARALEGQAQTFEMQGLKKDGEARMLLITYTPIYDEGRVTSVLAIARDVTEERLARERAAQADKLRALGQLASGVAHNFNNILAAILGHAQLIRRDSKDERTIKRLDIIEHAALDGAQTVKRIQGFGLQQDASVCEAIDINQLVQDSTNLTQARWREEAQARGLYYEVETELQPLPVIQGAASELREVFVNIILNALDAMPQGGRLRITTQLKGSTVRVNFIDSGIGMSREVRNHIFEPFFTTKGVAGMGLGLAVSYSIIERHGGTIEARSNLGRGSTFTISLPVAGAPTQKDARDRAAEVGAANVLIIDDDERVREAMAGMLSSAGHQTDQAASGREGLAIMERGQFNLVFTDLSMPEMDGWAVAGEIRRRWPKVKIVLITGYALPPDLLTHQRELIDEIIYKPIRFDDISATLHEVLA
jgi:PAS domain S-box-containing protein